MAKIVLHRGKEKSLLRFHPWVFSGAIRSIDKEIEEGDLVDVYTAEGEFIAHGYYQIGSIAVRIFSFEQESIDRAFWKAKLASALRVRRASIDLDSGETDTYRLVHGEGDGIPGLIVDVYGSLAVVQCHTVGIYRLRQVFAELLIELYEGKLNCIYDKSEKTLPYQADIDPHDGYLVGTKLTSNIVKEQGIQFYIDWEKGQKTGFFLDQRANRALLGAYSKGKSVLNLCCYTGGFSLYALQGGAKLVHSVDSSSRAIEMTRQNVELNFPDDKRHEAFDVDVFKFLDQVEGQYDVVILDPPAFAKHKKVLRNALQGYRNMNAKTLHRMPSGSILFTFSCSQVVSTEQFRTTLFSAAIQAGKKIRILHQLHQSPDHPCDIYHPEGEYLKGLVLYVE